MIRAVVLLAAAVLVWPGGVAVHRIRAMSGTRKTGLRMRWAWIVCAIPLGALLIGPAQALAFALAAGTGRELWSRSRSRRERSARISAALAGIDAMVAELSVGAHPAAACATASRDAEQPEIAAVFTEMAGRAELGGDVAAGLRRHGTENAAWVRLAAAWDTGVRHGIGMGELLAAVCEDLRSRERYDKRAHSALAGARATVQVLAALPLLGVIMGQMIGANPVGTLIGSSLGGILLVVGVCLTSTGLLWSRSIADRAANLGDRAGGGCVVSGYGPLAGSLALIALAFALLPVAARARLLAGLADGRSAGRISLLPGRNAKPDPFAAAAAYDLFAVCLRAGMPTADAARAVGEVATPALSVLLGRAAELLSLGSDPETAWRSESDDPHVVVLTRMLRRSARAGSSPATGLADLARSERAQAEDRAVAAGERAGVAVAGPLGLCFLPAFVCLGIVPVVMGLAGKVLGGGLL